MEASALESKKSDTINHSLSSGTLDFVKDNKKTASLNEKDDEQVNGKKNSLIDDGIKDDVSRRFEDTVDMDENKIKNDCEEGDDGGEEDKKEGIEKGKAEMILEEAWLSLKAAKAKARAVGTDLGKEMKTVTEFVAKIKAEITSEKNKLAELREEHLMEVTSVHAHSEEEIWCKTEHQSALEEYLSLATKLGRFRTEHNIARIRLGTLKKALKEREDEQRQHGPPGNQMDIPTSSSSSSSSSSSASDIHTLLEEDHVLAMSRLSLTDPSIVSAVDKARDELKAMLQLLQDTKNDFLIKEQATMENLLSKRAEYMEKVDFWENALKFATMENKKKIVPSTLSIKDYIREMKQIRKHLELKLQDTRTEVSNIVSRLLMSVMRKYTICKEKMIEMEKAMLAEKPYGAPESEDLAMLDRLVELNAKRMDFIRQQEEGAESSPLDESDNVTHVDTSSTIHGNKSQLPFTTKDSPQKPPGSKSSFKSPKAKLAVITSPPLSQASVRPPSPLYGPLSNNKKNKTRPNSVGATNTDNGSPNPNAGLNVISDGVSKTTSTDANINQIKEILTLLRQHVDVEARRAKLIATRNGLRTVVDRQAATLLFACHELSNSGCSSAFTDREIPVKDLVMGARPKYHDAVTVTLCGSQKCGNVTTKLTSNLPPAYPDLKQSEHAQSQPEDELSAIEAYATSIGKEAISLENLVSNLQSSLFSKEAMSNFIAQSANMKALKEMASTSKVMEGGSHELSLHAPSLAHREPSLQQKEIMGSVDEHGADSMKETSQTLYPSTANDVGAKIGNGQSYFFTSTQLSSSSDLNNKILSQFVSAGLQPLLRYDVHENRNSDEDREVLGLDFGGEDGFEPHDSIETCVAAARIASCADTFPTRRVIFNEDMRKLYAKGLTRQGREDIVYSDW